MQPECGFVLFYTKLYDTEHKLEIIHDLLNDAVYNNIE